MFFDNPNLERVKRTRLAELPRTPETGWVAPRDYPNFQYAVAIGFDFEVKEMDPVHGNGWARGQAHICGGSIDLLFPDGSTYTEYRPTRHEVDAHLNLDEQQTHRFWKDVLETNIPKFGANLQYDCGNASDIGIYPKGELHDCQYAEALIDESALVDLDTLGEKYLGQGKTTNLLYEWCAKAYGDEPTGKQRMNIYRASPKLVGPYGEGDAAMPRQIVRRQYNQLVHENLWGLYRMECDLIPLYVRMRRQGVRVDVDKAERMYGRLTPIIAGLYEQIYQRTGVRVECTTGSDILKIFTAIESELDIKPPLTGKGVKEAAEGNPNPTKSFAKEYLSEVNHPVANLVLEIRKMEILQNTFLANYILGANVKGIVHGSYHPLRGDDGGAKTGRYSSSDPNLTNIPIRTELGKEVRSCFVPFIGHYAWIKGDYSQIQYRGLAHYAVGQGAEELRAAYVADPKTDYHDKTSANVLKLTGLEIPRKPTKNLNFAIVFGAGEKKVKRMLSLDGNCTIQQAGAFYTGHHKGNPYIKDTMEAVSNEAAMVGYSTSPLGRRLRFQLWEPIEVNYENRAIPLPFDRAIKSYGSRIKRAMTHTAISGKLQGLEGDLMKTTLWTCFTSGVFDVTGVPTVIVHDENGFSLIDESPRQVEAYRYIKHVAENTVKLRVPILFKMEKAADWGSID